MATLRRSSLADDTFCTDRLGWSAPAQPGNGAFSLSYLDDRVCEIFAAFSMVDLRDREYTNISVVRGVPDGLTEQAIEAAQKIRFEPAVKDGRRVSVRGNLEFNFSLKPRVDNSTTDQGRDQEKSEQTSSGVKQEETMASEDIHSMDASLRPSITYKEKAEYTPKARANKVEGTVVLNAVFSAEGRVTGIRVLRGLPDGLTEQAILAAQKIRFEPAIKDGKPVSVRGNLEFNFSAE